MNVALDLSPDLSLSLLNVKSLYSFQEIVDWSMSYLYFE